MAEIFNATYENPQEITRYDEDFYGDPNFVEASKILYELNKGKRAEPLSSNKEYAKYGLEYMGWFNHNVTKMAMDAERVRNVRPEQANAFLYLMDSTDDLATLSLKGAGRFIKGNFGASWEHGALPDPLNFLGLFTGGALTAAGFSAKQATKEGFKQLLKASVQKGGFVGAGVGAMYTGVDSGAREAVRSAVSGEPINKYNIAKDSAIGAVGGLVVGTAATAVSAKVSNYITSKKAPKAIKKAKSTEDKLALDLKLSTEAISEVVDTPSASTELKQITSSLDDLIKSLKQTADTTLAVTEDGTQNYKSLSEAVLPLRGLLVEAAEGNPSTLVERIVDTELTSGQTNALKSVVFDTINALKAKKATIIETQKIASGNDAKLLYNEKESLERVIDTVGDLDRALSTESGRSLGYRAGGLNTGDMRKFTDGTDDEFMTLYNRWASKIDNTPELQELKVKVQEAKQKGNYEKYITLQDEVEALEKNIAVSKMGIPSKVYDKFVTANKALNEIMIGNVFSPKTIMLNMLGPVFNTITDPLTQGIAKDGLSLAARKSIFAQYKAMWDFRDIAIKAAQASFRYERSILSGDSARFLEQYNIIPKNVDVGGFRVPVAQLTRFFPRVLLATDTLFEQLHYRGNIVGNAMFDAYKEASERGIKNVDEFVSKKVDRAIKNAYRTEDNAVDLLRADGKSRGFKGQKLINFVKTELNKLNENKQLLNKANVGDKAIVQDGPKSKKKSIEKFNRENLDWTQDILYKREFSDSPLGKAAKGYERLINKVPFIRTLGQLFFRTPVRAFEKATYYTPFTNFLNPKWMADLYGANGTKAQIRANQEALISYFITANTLIAYADGRLTGALNSIYGQRKQLEDSRNTSQYSYKFSDGSTFQFRNADPFSTNVKIQVNAFERLEEIQYRQSQGEYISKDESELAFNSVVAATGALAQSIRDANLTEGIQQLYEGFTNVTEEEGYDRMVRFVAEKLRAATPSTLYKLQLYNNPEIADAATFEQYFLQQINPGNPKVPKQYDAVGRPRRIANVNSTLNMFSLVRPEQRTSDITKKEHEVNIYIANLGQASSKTFAAQKKHPLLPQIDDLRLVPTKTPRDVHNGDKFIGESLYDRWMFYTLTRTSIVDDVHKESLKNRAWGTESVDGQAVLDLDRVLNRNRDKAMRLLIKEEGLKNAKLQQQRRVIDIKRNDSAMNVPINIGNR